MKKQHTPTISVIIPVYKVAAYLPKCIDSVLGQTYQDFELILVSDGPEEDHRICDEYATKDSRITVIKNISKGLGGARNAGLAVAKGKYISFIDSDDWIDHTFLAKMYQAMTNSPRVDLVQCGTRIEVENNCIDAQHLKWDEEYFAIKETETRPSRNTDFGSINVATWNKLYRRQLIETYHLTFPENMYNEDAYFSWSYFSVCDHVAFVPEKLYHYLRRSNSLMAFTFKHQLGDKVLDHYRIGQMLYTFLHTHHLWHKRAEGFWRALQVCWWFVRDNGTPFYIQQCYSSLRRFLTDKEIPPHLSELLHIRDTSFATFAAEHDLARQFRWGNIVWFDIRKKNNSHATYRLFGKINLFKIKWNDKTTSYYLCGIRVKKAKVASSISQPTPEQYAFDNHEYPNIGKYTYGWQEALKYACSPVSIGNFCSIAPHVVIAPSQHDIWSITSHHFHQDQRYGNFVKTVQAASHWSKKIRDKFKDNTVIIKNDVWIGINAVILPGVTIGNGAVIAAGAIVTHDVPNFAIVAGAPAKIIRYRFDEETRNCILKSEWWNWEDSFIKKHINLFSSPDKFCSFVRHMQGQ